jgi:hypothetical protein
VRFKPQQLETMGAMAGCSGHRISAEEENDKPLIDITQQLSQNLHENELSGIRS